MTLCARGLSPIIHLIHTSKREIKQKNIYYSLLNLHFNISKLVYSWLLSSYFVFFFFNLTFKTQRNIRKLVLWLGLVFISNTKHCITIIVYFIRSYHCFFHLAEKYSMGIMKVDWWDNLHKIYTIRTNWVLKFAFKTDFCSVYSTTLLLGTKRLQFNSTTWHESIGDDGSYIWFLGEKWM